MQMQFSKGQNPLASLTVKSSSQGYQTRLALHGEWYSLIIQALEHHHLHFFVILNDGNDSLHCENIGHYIFLYSFIRKKGKHIMLSGETIMIIGEVGACTGSKNNLENYVF